MGPAKRRPRFCTMSRYYDLSCFFFSQVIYCSISQLMDAELFGRLCGLLDPSILPALGDDVTLRLSTQVLCSAWKDDGMTVFSAGCDKQIKMWPLLSGGQPTTFSGHEGPVKELAWVPQMNLLVSGSWDKTLRFGHQIHV